MNSKNNDIESRSRRAGICSTTYVRIVKGSTTLLRIAGVLLAVAVGTISLSGCGGGGTSVTSAPLVTGTRGTSITVGVDNSSAQAGQSINLTATLTTSGGQPVAGKTVAFSLGLTPEGSGVTNAQGVVTLPCVLSASLASQSYTVVASFPGDSDYAPCQSLTGVTVQPPAPQGQPPVPPAPPVASTMISLVLDQTTAQAGQTVNLTATLSAAGALVSGYTVTFSLNGVQIGTAVTNSSGQAILAYVVAGSTPTGVNSVLASFAGNQLVGTPCSASASFTVTSTKILTSIALGTPAVTNSNLQSTVTVSARLTDASGNPLPGATLSAAAGGQALGFWQSTGSATTDANGNASLAVQVSFAYATPGIVSGPAILIPPLGAIHVPVLFAGDTTHAASMALLSVNVP